MTPEAAAALAVVDDLADQIALCAARFDAALRQLLTHIRRFDELEGWAKHSCKSCAHWLSWRIGLGMVAAREKVRVAKALGTLPPDWDGCVRALAWRQARAEAARAGAATS